MPQVTLTYSSRQPYALREFAETLADELTAQAVPAQAAAGAPPQPREGEVTLVLDPRRYTELEGDEAFGSDAELRRMIFICEEPPPAAGDEDHRALLARAGMVFATDQQSVAALHHQGIPARLLRAGYARSLDRYDASAERPVDLLLIGAASERRSRWLDTHSAALSGLGLEVQVQLAEELPSAEQSDAALARPRWERLAQAKMVALIHAGEDHRFRWREALDAIHAGAVVITEHAHGIAPLEPGRQLLASSPGALPDIAAALVRDEPRLAEIRAAAYDRLRHWIPYALWVSILRAAIVERVGEPLSA